MLESGKENRGIECLDDQDSSVEVFWYGFIFCPPSLRVTLYTGSAEHAPHDACIEIVTRLIECR